MKDLTDALAAARAGGDSFAMANCIRALSMDAVEAARSGHPGAPMGMAEAATALWTRHLKFDAADPDWPDRDRFVLSNGHGSMLLYSLLHLTGFADMTLDQIRNFRQWGAITAGHPEYGHVEGVETTTGPLGQGLATAVGMAIAEEAMRAQFGEGLCNHRTWVIAGDGCLMEGISQEAIALAGHQKLKNLIVLWDDNDITIDGRVSLSDATDQMKRFEASGWRVLACDGHDPVDIERALTDAATGKDDRPVLVACKTIIGYGAPKKQDTSGAHGSPLGAEEIAATRLAYGWEHESFIVPDDILADWRAIGMKGRAAREAWAARVDAAKNREEFARRISGDVSDRLAPTIAALKEQALQTRPKIATRKASEMVLEVLNPELPETIGGSADLTGSNLTRVKAVDSDFQPGRYDGRYVSWGVREFGMCAAMNGMSCHGGLIPYGGTFLVFSDYARNAIRLSALMGVGTIYVMTHDSIGLGEDGPTHQPVEHLASLRAMPNLNVFRPADAVETLECWELALRSRNRPSLLALSRQNVPQLRLLGDRNLSARGAYVIHGDAQARDLTLLATGTEVALAVEAATELAGQGIRAAVVSMPSWELFEEQSRDYRRAVLGDAPRIAVEAASTFGWTRYVASDADVIGMRGFGASAPAPVLYEQFGITAAAIVARAKILLA